MELSNPILNRGDNGQNTTPIPPPPGFVEQSAVPDEEVFAVEETTEAPSIPEEEPVTQEEVTTILEEPESEHAPEEQVAFEEDNDQPVTLEEQEAAMEQAEQEEVVEEATTEVEEPTTEEVAATLEPKTAAVFKMMDAVIKQDDEKLKAATEELEAINEQEEAAPVEEEITLTAIEDTNSKKMARVDSMIGGKNSKNTLTVKDITNRSLAYFLNDFFRTGKNATPEVDAELPISGVYIQSNKTEGIWDEGGATSNNGHCLIATNPEGEKLPPVFVYHSPNVVNGRHALVGIWPGCYIVLAGHQYGNSVVAVYKVKDIQPKLDPNQKYPRFNCSLIATMLKKAWYKHDLSDKIWNENHPAIQAAAKRIYTINANSPCFVADYRENYFDPKDFNDCLQDQEFMAEMEACDVLEDAYEYVGDTMSYFVKDLTKTQRALITTSLKYFEAKNVIGVFLFGMIYDQDKQTSRGERKCYARVLLKPGDKFFYLDRDPSHSVPYEELTKILTNYGGTLATTFRRMTE